MGGGKAAQALSLSLRGAGLSVSMFNSRDLVIDVADADVVFVAVADDAIAAVAARVSAIGAPLVVHLAGSVGVDALAGARRGAFHVLASLSPTLPLPPGAVCAIDADVDGDRVALQALALSLGLAPVHITSAQRAAYHASAVIAGNLATALLQLGADLAERVGVDAEVARVGLAQLLASTAARSSASPLPLALTGPVARGDVDTVRRHLEAIASVTSADDVTRDVYLTLSRVLV